MRIHFIKKVKIRYGWAFISLKQLKIVVTEGVYFVENAEIRYVSEFIPLKGQNNVWLGIYLIENPKIR